MKTNQPVRSCQTLNFASNDPKLKTRVENWCEENNKKLILSEPKSPDIIAFNSFAIIADPEFVGKENIESFVEFQKLIEFSESTYEDEEVFNFYKQCFDLDENGKFNIDPTELLLTNELNTDAIISKLEKYVNL